MNIPTLPVPGTSATFPARVFAKVDATGDCWEWTAIKDGGGYGSIGRGARGAGMMGAHRAVWELLVGPIPEGMEYDHLCRNHGCVNPDHAEIVMPEVNRARGFGVSELHLLRETCPEGHPKDGRFGARGGRNQHRYCKTCARRKSSERYQPKGPAQFCQRNHEFTPENTYIDPGRGHRCCRTCKASRQRQARAAAIDRLANGDPGEHRPRLVRGQAQVGG